jgi:hypothetical protein
MPLCAVCHILWWGGATFFPILLNYEIFLLEPHPAFGKWRRLVVA